MDEWPRTTPYNLQFLDPINFTLLHSAVEMKFYEEYILLTKLEKITGLIIHLCRIKNKGMRCALYKVQPKKSLFTAMPTSITP